MRVALLFQPRIAASVAHAQRTQRRLKSRGLDAWCVSSWEITDRPDDLAGANLVVTFGGDGTLLRAARAAAPHAAVCVGVNYGRLGFLTEFTPDDFDSRLDEVLDGGFWIEERVLIDWTHYSADNVVGTGLAAGDVVVGRGRMARVVEVEVRINGVVLTTYTSDGVIVATPTGTTGYVQAAGGPVLHPEVRDLVMTPLVPFLTPANSIVVGHDERVELTTYTTHEATLSVDGQTDQLLASGDRVVCRASEHLARFARFRESDYFYATLAEKMRWRVPREMPRPVHGSG
jgi:NAD+ kinase